MKLSNLQLERIVLDGVSVQTSDEVSPEEQGGAIDVEIKEIAQKDDDPSRWRIAITVSLNEDKGGTLPPYTGFLAMTGYFVYPCEQVPDMQAGYVVAVNGASLLYGSAREHLWNLTSKGRWGAFLLPTADFRGLRLDPQNEDVQLNLEADSEIQSAKQ